MPKTVLIKHFLIQRRLVRTILPMRQICKIIFFAKKIHFILELDFRIGEVIGFFNWNSYPKVRIDLFSKNLFHIAKNICTCNIFCLSCCQPSVFHFQVYFSFEVNSCTAALRTGCIQEGNNYAFSKAVWNRIVYIMEY